MKISLNWLGRYLPHHLSPQEIGELLTNTGLETESIEKVESLRGGLLNVTVGKVIEVSPHPDADRLRLTKVDVGKGELLQIVCGATNVAAGQKVIVALPGATLYPSDGEPITIKKGKIRGQESAGMICAEDEIGIGTSHEGIMVLEPETTVGLPASEFFQLKDDYVLEIGLTPNRTDAMCHYGVARDLAAAMNQHKKGESRFSAQLPMADLPASLPARMAVKFNIADREKCVRYAGICLDNVKVGPSPEWMVKSLQSVGLKPINNVVDVTNFVMHECGQPLHAFDAGRIAGNEINIRTFPQGTPFVTLDGTLRELNENDLMIADTEKPLCIAGVFGGKDSGVSESTSSIFIESALFHPASVRKTARRHGLNTDASFRFERGVDPEMVVFALRRAALLLTETANAQIASGVTDVYSEPISPAMIDFSPEKCRKLTGCDISESDMKSILSDLDILVKSQNQEKWILSVPRYRADVTREADVTEEILRIYGYNRVEIPSALKASLAYTDRLNNEKYVNRVSDLLAASGFLEIMGNSLTKGEYASWLNDPAIRDETLVPMLNPLSSDLNIMRPTMLFSGLESIALNISHRQENLRLFEFGKTYRKEVDGYSEQSVLSIFVTGRRFAESWRNKLEPAGFQEIAGALDRIFASLGLAMEAGERWTAEHVSQGLEYQLGQKCIVRAGEVSDTILKRMDIDQSVYYAEVYWDLLTGKAEKSKVKFRELAKFPAVRRDLSLLVDTNVTFGALQNTAIRSNSKLIKEVSLFDVYEGKNLESGKKSYALSIFMQDERATMTDGQIRQIMDRVTANLEKEHGAKLRV